MEFCSLTMLCQLQVYSTVIQLCCCCVLATQSCPTLGDPWTVPTGLLCPWNFPGKNRGVDSHSLLQGIFPTQGLNLTLPCCRQILYHLIHQGSLIRIYICVCVYIYMYVCMYVCIHIRISVPFKFLLGYHKVLSRVPCAIQQVFDDYLF